MKCHWPKDCEQEVSQRGLCEQHYQTFAQRVPLAWKDLYALGWADPEVQAQFVCHVQGCTVVTHYAKGLCAGHYQKAKYVSIAKPKRLCNLCQHELTSIWFEYEERLYCTSSTCLAQIEGYPNIKVTKYTIDENGKVTCHN